MPSRKEIADFLKKFKQCAQNKFQFVFRKKNLDAITSLGITIIVAKEIILGLTPDNYCQGPDQDRDKPHSNLWVFETDFDGKKLYIKLSDNFSYDIAKCISFHQKEF